jgi:NAD(P)H-nitrite reductase large subunit
MAQGKRIVIVGGVAGGASAAAKARRVSEEAEIILFERGADISFANCGLPYHVGGIIADRARLLVQSPEAMRKRFAVDVRTHSEVLRIDRAKKVVVVHDKAKDRQYEQPYDALILSPGAEPVRPPIPGADNKRVFTLRNLADMDAIKAVVDAKPGLTAVVVGGGYIGLEMAESLKHRGVAVSLVELESQVMGPIDPEMAAPLHEHMRLQGVDLNLGASVTAIKDSDGRVEALLSSAGRSPATWFILAWGSGGGQARRRGGLTSPAQGHRRGRPMRTCGSDIYGWATRSKVQDFVGGFARDSAGGSAQSPGPHRGDQRLAATRLPQEPRHRDLQGFRLAVA